jgi:cytochrome c oxidase assembly factor CtaG
LAAYLVVCDRIVYRGYLVGHHNAVMSVLTDQQWAGAVMWIAVTFLYVVPAIVMTLRLIRPSRGSEKERTERSTTRNVHPGPDRQGRDAHTDASFADC